MANLTEYIKSGSFLTGGDEMVETVVIGLGGTPTQLIVYQGKIYVYDSEGQALIDGGYISTTATESLIVTTEKLTSSSQKFINNIPFTPYNKNRCDWESGSIVFSDGTIVSVYSGSTGNINATTYIYYNGSSILKATYNKYIAIASSNIPLAIVEPVDYGKCLVTPFLSSGTCIDGNKISTGIIKSHNGKTFFDLNNNRIEIDDNDTTRVVIGKMNDGSYGIKASLPKYTADVDTDVNHYALWSTSNDAVDNVLIKEKTRGSVSVDGGGYLDNEEIEHGLGYVPFVLVFCEKTSGTYTKAYGWDMYDDGIAYWIDDTYLTFYNNTGSTKTFKYYIFYDRISSGIYEEIFVHDYVQTIDEVTI